MSTEILLAALCTAMLMPAWILVARKLSIHDAPDRRRLHAATVPRGAGMCIALTLAIGLSFPQGATLLRDWGLALVGVLAFVLIGLWDDLRSPAAGIKLSMQALAAILFAWALCAGWPFPKAMMLPLLALCCLVLVNFWNFMDGINGLAATQAALIAVALAFWPDEPSDLGEAAAWLAGACLGFLPFNLLRARAFLGDSGSYLLGSAVFLMVVLFVREGRFSPPQALVLCSGILFDAGFTLLHRALRGRNLWRAHREHLYQYAVRRGRSHVEVSLMYALWTTFAAALAWSMRELAPTQQWLCVAVLGVIAWTTHAGLKAKCLIRQRGAEVMP